MTHSSAARVYLDYHATTPVDPRVVAVVVHYMSTGFGNASSADHCFGDEAEAAVATARTEVAELVDATPESVVFTSGATESINLAIQGFVRATGKGRRTRIVVSPVEHSAVLETCRAMARDGLAEVRELSVDIRGRLDLNAVEDECAAGADLICVMAANNEIGNIYPVEELGKLAQRHGVAFLCDATQACGKIPLSVRATGITFFALSGHKMYGPKGVGSLVVTSPRALHAISFGGEHERRLRPGTLNVPGIAGLGEACRLRRLEMRTDEAAVASRRDRLQELLVENIDGLVVNGDVESRLAGNLHVSVPDVPNGAMVARVRDRLAIATGSACSSGIDSPSHVLRAMQLPTGVIDGALRIGLGKFTTDVEVDRAASILIATARSARASMARHSQLNADARLCS